MKIAIVGTSYVGLVTGVCLAEIGHTVACVDADPAKVDQLKRGQATIHEDGLDRLLASNLESQRISFSTSLREALADASVVFIAVGTPQSEDGSADLSHVKKVAEEIGALAPGDLVIVVKSTVPVGTGNQVETIVKTQLKSRKVDYKLTVTSNPEFLREGVAIEDFMKPDRIIIGVNDKNVKPVFRDIYGPFVIDDPNRLIFMRRPSAELTKYAANAMLATRISFMNELAQLCDKVGANIDDVRVGIGTDFRIGKKFLYAGPGYGGSCFPKDVKALMSTGKQTGVGLSVINAVDKANTGHRDYAVNKIVSYFGDLKNKRIAVWGLSFKPGTDDIREAPAYHVTRKLIDKGAHIVGHDPVAGENFARLIENHPNYQNVDDAYAAVEGADAVVLVTEWSEYRKPNWLKIGKLMRHRAVFDFRNQYDGAALKQMGFYYDCIGRPLG